MNIIDIKGLRITDLTPEIKAGMWDYNPIGVPMPDVGLEPIATVEEHGYLLHTMNVTTLTACYVETPGHMVQGAPLLDGFGVESFVKPARIMRLPKAEPYTLYTLDDLKRADPGLQPGEALIIQTGWGPHCGAEDYVTKAPAFAFETLDWLVEQQFSILALDTPVLACLWAEQVEPKLVDEVGTDLLGGLFERRQDMLLAGPLINLERVETLEGTLIALPLNVPEACSASARIVFVEGVKLSA